MAAHKEKILSLSQSFSDAVKLDTARTIRLVRESIEAKRGQERIVRLKFGLENVTIKLSEGFKLTVSSTCARRKRSVFAEEDLPELFSKHVRHYLANLNWDLSRMQMLTSIKKYKALESLMSKAKIEEEFFCNYRGAFFIAKTKTSYDVYGFSPLETTIKYMLSKPTIGEAKIVAENLSLGRCFTCKTKLGTSTLCSDHQFNHTLTYLW